MARSAKIVSKDVKQVLVCSAFIVWNECVYLVKGAAGDRRPLRAVYISNTQLLLRLTSFPPQRIKIPPTWYLAASSTVFGTPPNLPRLPLSPVTWVKKLFSFNLYLYVYVTQTRSCSASKYSCLISSAPEACTASS